MRHLAILAGLLVPATMTLPALAQDVRPAVRYGATYRAYGGYPAPVGGGFAQPFIQGDYIGAPLTAFPRPTQIVPTPWSYGTYGIPTVSGIAAPPVAAPTLTVIQSPRPKKAARRGGFVSAADDPSGVRVVNLTAPRR
ncbi:MAG: hypothetical protein INR70_28785 [Parafilimonas terrae]|nr:hypothetical protein [Parafilimonas terrae]